MRSGFAILLLITASSEAWGQSRLSRPVPPPRPVISPYLNLFRAGNSPAFNYLTLVRPEQEIRKSVDVLQQDVTRQAATNAASAEGELTTGHAFGFMTHGRFFNTTGGRGGFSTVGAPITNRGAAPRGQGSPSGASAVPRGR